MQAPPTLIAVFAQLAAALSHAPTGPDPQGSGQGVVLFGGDVVPHGDVLASLHAHGEASLLGPVAGVLSRAELAFANLETPVVPSRPESPDGAIRFNVHEDFARALASAGLDGVAVANNHGYDQGYSGVGDTLRATRASGLVPFGGADAGGDPLAPARFPFMGGTLCAIGVSRLLNFDVPPAPRGSPRMALARHEVSGEEANLLEHVRAARSTCDVVLVSVHTGVEYEDRPEPRDRVFFRALALAGADAVLAHHSHTPQPVDVHRVEDREVPVFYSLGNLVSAQGSAAERAPLGEGEPFQVVRDARTREGLLAALRFTREGRRLRLARWGYLPLWTENDREQARARRLAPTLSAAFMPWRGGETRLLRSRWEGLLRRVGARHLYPPCLLPGAETAFPPEALDGPQACPPRVPAEGARSP